MAKTKDQKKINENLPVKYPGEVLKPVRRHLAEKLTDLEKRKRQVSTEDPFRDTQRTVDNASIDTDAAEQAGHMQVSALKLAYERSIIQIRKALSRIKIGKYGVCENCGKMIDTDRLMIVPETTVCVECEKSRER
jgi:RNA polymerase-binding transcription factor DksA